MESLASQCSVDIQRCKNNLYRFDEWIDCFDEDLDEWIYTTVIYLGSYAKSWNV